MSHATDRLTAALADRYRIERELGAGGMATVYLAHDLKHDRKIAIKVLKPELAAALGPERFLREITTTAGLRHPHILPLYDSGDADGLLYYVMPLVEGESLRDRLARAPQLPLDEALGIAAQVADALSYAHAQGIVHRDIKPENILLESGHAVVADFGIARAIDAAGQDALTQTGLAIGTPQYMSPEQAAGERNLDGRSDLYALACVLFEMLTGQPPFTGPTMASVVHQHLAAQPPSVDHFRPGVPPGIATALQRALAKSPADRFNPAAQFAEALRSPAAGTTPGAARRSRGILLAAGATVVLGLVMVLLATRAGRNDAPPPSVGRTAQVTLEPGLEVDPALSPDGQFVAYAGGPVGAMRIYVRQVAGGRTVTLTSDSAGHARWPRWSPDGTRIAYQAREGVYVVPALGGSPRLVARTPPALSELMATMVTPVTGVAWSPDGGRIAVVRGALGGARVDLVNVEIGDSVTLAAPRDAHSPAWSPDGGRIAVVSGNPIFVFGITYFGNGGSSSIWSVPVNGGAPIRVTEDEFMDGSPQWSPDGRFLWFLSDRGGSRDVYRVPVDGSGAPTADPVRVTTGLGAHTISLSPDGSRLAYSRLEITSNIWALPVPTGAAVAASGLRPVTSGSQTIEDLDVTADGRWLVFDSDRSGNAEIYKMPSAGGEAIQLTSDPAGDFGTAWSPDGSQVAFHSMRNGNRDLFTVRADGTGLTQQTRGPLHELDADWSPDGRFLVAEVIDTALETPTFGIVPVDGSGTVRQVPGSVGDFAVWSPRGDRIAYHTGGGIRSFAPDGSDDRLLVPNPEGIEAFYVAWSPDGRALYTLARGPAGWQIRVSPGEGGPSRLLVRFDDQSLQPAAYGFATDGRTFYLTMGSRESDIWVADLVTP